MKLYKEKMEQMDQRMKNKEYKEAVQELIWLIEKINQDTIHKELNFYDIMEFYRLSDKARYEIMIEINAIYEQMTNKKIVAKDSAIMLKQNCQKLIELINQE